MRSELNIPFAKLNPEARLPTQGSALAAGWDLYALESVVVPKGSSIMIPTGLACAIPEGWEGQIRCRSSLGKKGMILPNGVGTIDADYRGELKVLATWIGSGEEFHIEKGVNELPNFSSHQFHECTSLKLSMTNSLQQNVVKVALAHQVNSEARLCILLTSKGST